MQVGIVLDNGNRYTNEEIRAGATIPIPSLGFRKYLIPDDRYERYMKNKILTVTELMNFLRLHFGDYTVDGGCIVKSYFDYNFPIYLHISELMSMLQGKMLHDALVPERKGIYKEMHVTGNLYNHHVEGDIDFYNADKGYVYDLKTAKSLVNIPKPMHVVQTYLYAKLLEQNNFPVNQTELVYLSHSEMAVALFAREEYDDSLSLEDVHRGLVLRAPININKMMMTNDEEAVGLTIAQNYRTGQFEPIQASWRCAYCPYRRYCPYAKENIKKFLSGVSTHTRSGEISRYFINKFLSIKSAGVKEGDVFMYPEEELFDVITDIYGSTQEAYEVADMISEKRKLKEVPVKPMVMVEW